MEFKKIIKNSLPDKVINILRRIIHFKSEYRLKVEIKRVRDSQVKIVADLRKKETLHVIFLVIHESVWKYEEVYKLLDKDPKFDVKVVAIPLVRDNKGDMDTYNQTLNYFITRDYNTISSYDEAKNKWIDIKSLTQPDIVFFTNPHKLTFDKYYIDNFTDKFTCYSPYTFDITKNFQGQYNKKFHNIVTIFFVETTFHYGYAKKFSRVSKAKNVIISGFPGLDSIYSDCYNPINVWKDYLGGKAKKIIWAPHHTIPGQGSGLDYSCFLNYADYFEDLLKSNKNIQIAFKPHPLLKEKLYKDSGWGKKKTDNYYLMWDKLPNGQLETGNYIDLFYFSDAMILDSASFTVEYLFFDKPSLFTVKDHNLLNRFNSFGQMVFDFLYKANNVSDIDAFIKEIVFKENDFLKEGRNSFIREELIPKDSTTASMKIYNLIKNI